MDLSNEDILKIIKLARLSAANEDIEDLTKNFNDILHYIEQLEEVNVDNIEPLAHVHEVANVFREDVSSNSLTTEQALANTKERSGDYIKVPLIVE